MNNIENILKESNLTDDEVVGSGAKFQYNRFKEILYKSRLKFKDDMIFRLGVAQKRMKIYFYNGDLVTSLKINSPKRAIDIREFFYQDNTRPISDKEYLKRLLTSCSDLMDIDESY